MDKDPYVLRDETIELIELIKIKKDVEENKNKIIDLWKAQENLPLNNTLSLFDKPFKGTEQTVLYLIVQFLLKNNCLEEFDCSRNEYLKKLKHDHLEYKRISDDLVNKRFESLENFIDQNPVGNHLKFYFSIYKFLTCDNIKDSLAILLKDVSQHMKSMPTKGFLKQLVFRDTQILNYVKSILEDLFVKEYCRLKMTSEYNYLEDILTVGNSTFQQMQGVTISNFDQEENVLPMEIKLPKGYNYHSLFICPVLKVLCTDENKPVLLNCNHVISLNAANVLSKFGSTETFKCPYCPEMCESKSTLILDL